MIEWPTYSTWRDVVPRQHSPSKMRCFYRPGLLLGPSNPVAALLCKSGVQRAPFPNGFPDDAAYLKLEHPMMSRLGTRDFKQRVGECSLLSRCDPTIGLSRDKGGYPPG